VWPIRSQLCGKSRPMETSDDATRSTAQGVYGDHDRVFARNGDGPGTGAATGRPRRSSITAATRLVVTTLKASATKSRQRHPPILARLPGYQGWHGRSGGQFTTPRCSEPMRRSAGGAGIPEPDRSGPRMGGPGNTTGPALRPDPRRLLAAAGGRPRLVPFTFRLGSAVDEPPPRSGLTTHGMSALGPGRNARSAARWTRPRPRRCTESTKRVSAIAVLPAARRFLGACFGVGWQRESRPTDTSSTSKYGCGAAFRHSPPAVAARADVKRPLRRRACSTSTSSREPGCGTPSVSQRGTYNRRGISNRGHRGTRVAERATRVAE